MAEVKNVQGDLVTERIASFVKNTNYEDLSQAVRQKAKEGILDTIGVIIAGTTDPIAEPILEYLHDIGGHEDATVIGKRRRTSVTGAAFANAVMGHVHDYDDTNEIFFGHPSVVVVPSILAACEKYGLGGKEAIAAYAIGTEVQWRLGDALVLNGDHYARGWHATGTIGTFGSAASSAKLLKLDREATRNSIGIAASEASGNQAQFGTQSKPFQAGRACESGLRAALLAKGGFGSAADVLESRVGFFQLVAGRYDIGKLTSFGEPFGIAETSAERGIWVKAHPICGAGNGVVGAVVDFHRASGWPLEEITAIECLVRPSYLKYLMYDFPKSGLEAKFSIQYWVAAALVYGKLDLPEITDRAIQNPKIQRLLSITTAVAHPELRLGTELKVRISRGAERRLIDCGRGKGSPDDPMSVDEINRKFISCGEWGGLKREKCKLIADMVMHLAEYDNLSELMKQMR